jgi:hypothetical protein
VKKKGERERERERRGQSNKKGISIVLALKMKKQFRGGKNLALQSSLCIPYPILQ